MTHITRVFALALVLATLVGCGASGSSPGGPKKYRIAVIPKGTTHEFWRSVHAGAEQAAEELGNVEVQWNGPLEESDRAGQIKVVQDFILAQVDGICLAPLDSQSLGRVVREAKDAGIPTVIFDSGLDDASVRVAYVATDNRNGGVLAARQMGKALGGKGDVIMLRYNVGSESTLQREEGFLDTLRKEFPDIKILSSDQFAGTTPPAALKKAQDMFLQYGDQVDGIFAVCEPNGMGVLKALESSGLAGKVKFITFDPSPALVEAMAAGHVHGIVLQDPIRMGYLAVQTMVAHLEGKQVDRWVPTGEYLATPENMKEPAMDKLLHPAQYGE